MPSAVWIRRCATIAALLAALSCSSNDEETADGTPQTSEVGATQPDLTTTQPDLTTTQPDLTTTETTAVESATTTSRAPAAASAGGVCGLDVSVSFNESAPRDRITIKNEDGSERSITAVEIDLNTTVGAIIFDTVSGGDGVEVFQDFRVEDGEATLDAEPVAEDGGTNLRLDFASFEPAERFTFSIDVDDQLPDSDLGQIQVTGAEIAGAAVVIETTDGESATATFDGSTTAIYRSDC